MSGRLQALLVSHIYPDIGSCHVTLAQYAAVIYATAGLGASAGIYVFSPEGEQLAFIDVPDNPTNCTFGGPDEPNTLYFTAQVITGNTNPRTMGLYRIKLNKKGHRLFP